MLFGAHAELCLRGSARVTSFSAAARALPLTFFSATRGGAGSAASGEQRARAGPRDGSRGNDEKGRGHPRFYSPPAIQARLLARYFFLHRHFRALCSGQGTSVPRRHAGWLVGWLQPASPRPAPDSLRTIYATTSALAGVDERAIMNRVRRSARQRKAEAEESGPPNKRRVNWGDQHER